jgi:hypothetical protein
LEQLQMTQQEKLPIPTDGYDDDDNTGSELIKGEIIKCIDGNWSVKGGASIPLGTQMVALSTAMALQHWKDGERLEEIVKTPGQPFPDLKALNDAIPEDEWELGMDDKPRAPWSLQYVVYLLDPKTGGIFTFINSTWGAMKAVTLLRDKVKMMRLLRGDKAVPIVALDSVPFKGKYGPKIRPEFTPIEYRILGAPITTPVSNTATPLIEHMQPVEEPTTEEILNDEMPPWNENDGGGDGDDAEFIPPPKKPEKSSNKKPASKKK